MARPRIYPEGSTWWRAPLTPKGARKVEAYMRRHDVTRTQAIAAMLERFEERRAVARARNGGRGT